MKITLRSPKPRNPLVAMARLRVAGSHRPTGGSRRQAAARQLQRELQKFAPPKQSP